MANVVGSWTKCESRDLSWLQSRGSSLLGTRRLIGSCQQSKTRLVGHPWGVWRGSVVLESLAEAHRSASWCCPQGHLFCAPCMAPSVIQLHRLACSLRPKRPALPSPARSVNCAAPGLGVQFCFSSRSPEEGWQVTQYAAGP